MLNNYIATIANGKCRYKLKIADSIVDESSNKRVINKDEILNNYEISEIFVLNNYKRNKIGKESVTKVFNLHRGNWTIKAVPNSIIAESFWKNIVKEYTNNNYIEEYTGKYNRLEIYFSNGN